MAGSLPRLPQRFMVRGETLRSSAASLTVKRSGKLSRLSLFLGWVVLVVKFLSMSDIEVSR